jgi:SAM-dependent methyltransferase
MELTKARAESLQQLRSALRQRPRPRPRPRPLTDERFDECHEHFERSSDQQQRIREWLRSLVGTDYQRLDPLRILSVGCGSGILDIPLIQSVASRSRRIDYTGIDPNPVACRRFRDDFGTLGLAEVRLEVREQNIEAAGTNDRFELIHAVHCLYYFADPAATLQTLLKRLAPGGKLVIIQAPKAELNQLADCFWHHHAGEGIWFSDHLERYFARQSLPFTKHRIDASVNVTRCFESNCPREEMMLDFITQTDCRQLDDEILELCLSYLRSVSRPKKDRLLVSHPVDVFTIEAAHRAATAPLARHAASRE